MGREIMFRGKHVHAFSCNEKMDGSWLYGYLSAKNYIHSPELECERLVDPKTVGQYTGLKDKHGKMIFEGDIVFVTDEDGNAGMVDTGLGEVYMLKGLWYICGNVQNSLYDCNDVYLIEVLGNVYDNPELIPETPEDE